MSDGLKNKTVEINNDDKKAFKNAKTCTFY